MCAEQGCSTRANYGMPGTRPTHCSGHRPVGAINLVNKLCEGQGCGKRANYGPRGHRPVHCASHAPVGSVNLSAKRCEVCDVNAVKAPRLVCGLCDPTKSRGLRVRERQVADFLLEQGVGWTHWNRRLKNTTYRPDFVWDTASHLTILEVDEKQHAGYKRELARMLDIYGACGGKPVVFVRWNPDAFALDGQPARVPVKTRLDVLKRVLQAVLAHPPQHPLTVHTMFYSQPEHRHIVSTHVELPG